MVPGTGVSGKVSMSAQQSLWLDVHFLQQSSVRSLWSNRQIRNGNPASGRSIPKQARSSIAKYFFKR